MPDIRGHGGGCCGVRHMVGFGHSFIRDPIREEDIEDLLRRHHLSNLSKGGRSQGKCIEAVITDNQFRSQPDLAQIMKNQGFRLVSRFHNSTGGMCNVLHRVSGERDIKRCRQPWVRALR